MGEQREDRPVGLFHAVTVTHRAVTAGQRGAR
jgi:hypothetical protein